MENPADEIRRRSLMAACGQVRQVEDELLAYRYFLRLCLDWLPQGLLRDTVRQVNEGRSAAEARGALEEMGADNG